MARAVQSAQDHRTAPGGGEGDRVGDRRIDIAHPGQDQGRGGEFTGHRGGGGGGGCREEGSHRGHRALGGGEYGRARAHSVAGQGQAFGMHGKGAVAEPDAGADIEGGEQVGGEVQVGGQRAALGIGGGRDDAPGREVFEQRAVVAGAVQPAVAERDRG